jgi:hypothetical protein
MAPAPASPTTRLECNLDVLTPSRKDRYVRRIQPVDADAEKKTFNV